MPTVTATNVTATNATATNATATNATATNATATNANCCVRAVGPAINSWHVRQKYLMSSRLSPLLLVDSGGHTASWNTSANASQGVSAMH